jgi:hypothetical protein
MHTVDERMPVKGLMEMVHFYHEFIRLCDERTMEETHFPFDLERRASNASTPSQHGCIR